VRASSILLPLLVLASACTAKLGGDVSVNGRALEPTSCRSGAVYGFRGVEVTGKSGVRLRVAATETGNGHVVVMPAGSAVGQDLGACGPFQVDDQNSTINGVKNVEGKATLDCAVDEAQVKGSLSFQNCH
jgi:hypothetical protein